MRRNLALVLIAGALLALPLAAQRLQGPEITVNSMPGVVPRASQVARAANGDTVVVWTGRLSSGADRIWMRRFSAAGKPKSRESLVASFAAGGQQDHPQIAIAPGGNFMVVWDMGDQYFHNASFGRCFSASGRALGSAFRLNPDNQDPIDLHPAVAAAPDGSFVATWASGPTESGYQGYNLLARRFAANGQPLGPAFKIVDPTLSYQNYPRVTVNGNGDLLFAWVSNQNVPSPASPFRLLVRRFDAEGHPLGDPLQVSEDHLSSVDGFNMTAAEDGEVLFTWIGGAVFPQSAPVLGQRCAADGTRIGGLLAIHAGEEVGPFAPPGIAAIPGGGYFVAWSTYSGPERIIGKTLASDGAAQGDDLEIDTAQYEAQPAVAIGRDGVGAVTWTTISFRRNRSALLLRRFIP